MQTWFVTDSDTDTVNMWVVKIRVSWFFQRIVKCHPLILCLDVEPSLMFCWVIFRQLMFDDKEFWLRYAPQCNFIPWLSLHVEPSLHTHALHPKVQWWFNVKRQSRDENPLDDLVSGIKWIFIPFSSLNCTGGGRGVQFKEEKGKKIHCGA